MRAAKPKYRIIHEAFVAGRLTTATFTSSNAPAVQVAEQEGTTEAGHQLLPATVVEAITRQNLNIISLPPYVVTGMQTALQAGNSSRLMRRRSQQLTEHLRLRTRSKARGGLVDSPSPNGAALLRNTQRKGKSWKKALKDVSKMNALPLSEDLEAMLEDVHGIDEQKQRAPNDPGKIEYDAAASAGYAAARLPACYAVAYRIFKELQTRMPGFRPHSLLDFGAGPGTAIWAATDVWGDSLQILHAVEPSSAMTWLGTQVEQQRRTDADDDAAAAAASTNDAAGEVTDGKEWHASSNADKERRDSSAGASTSGRAAQLPSVRWLQRLRGFRDKQDRGVRSRKTPGKWIQSSGSNYDLVVASYSLIELEDPQEARWALKALWEATADVLVLVVPGTPSGSALIRAARSQVLNWETDASGKRDAHVVAPCPHDGRCPMDDKSTWCHFSQRFERTELQRLVKLRKGHLPPRDYQDERFSYVVLRRGPRPLPGPDVAVSGGVPRRLPPDVERAMAVEAQLQAEEEDESLEQLLMSDEEDEVMRLILASVQAGGDEDDVRALVQKEWEGLQSKAQAKSGNLGTGPAERECDLGDATDGSKIAIDPRGSGVPISSQLNEVPVRVGSDRHFAMDPMERMEAREGTDDQPEFGDTEYDQEVLEAVAEAAAEDSEPEDGDADAHDPQLLAAAVAASQQWSRIIRPPRKHHRLIVVDTCAAAGPPDDPAAEGRLLKQTLGASDRDSWLGKEGFRFVRRSRWGDLWPSSIQQQAREVQSQD